MKLKYFLIIFLFIISLWKANFAQAIAIKVSPPEIEIEISPKVVAQQEIIVENPSFQVALYEVYVDEFSDWIIIKPESFILESKDSQIVILEIKNKERGIFSTTISVVAKPLSERKFKANSGVKIPLEIRISEEKSEFWLASISRNFERLSKNPQNLIYIFSIILILVLFGVWVKRKKKISKEKNHHDSLTMKF